MAIGTTGAHEGKTRILMTVPAMNRHVPPLEGITRGGMVELLQIFEQGPGTLVMAQGTIQLDVTVGVPRPRRLGRLCQIQGPQGHDENQH
jgi:hypothetical protein